MTQKPGIGEVIVAKYGGTCTRTGEAYDPGAKIARDRFGYYLEGAPDPGGDIAISFGSGEVSRFYGPEYAPQEVGETVWHGERAVVITRASRTYYREDGLSFGVGADRGYIYHHLARPATPEEAAPLLAAREARRQAAEKARRLQAGLATLFDWRQAGDANTPEGRNLVVRGRALKIGEGFNIYGGGEELVEDLDGEHVWLLRNNGMDGDDWSRNNVTTGGAGAIGIRFPLTQGRRAFLDEHWPATPAPVATAADDDLDTL